MTQIRILEGTYKIRGKDVDLTGMVFPMVENFKVGAKGGYVTVDGSAVAGFPQRNIKIACAGSDSYEDAGSAKRSRTKSRWQHFTMAIYGNCYTNHVGRTRTWRTRTRSKIRLNDKKFFNQSDYFRFNYKHFIV